MWPLLKGALSRGHTSGQISSNHATVSLCQVELFGLTAEEVYLVHDELDKPLGKLALKLGGSARGHNGVRSCISCLNSNVSLPLCPALGRVGQHVAPDTPHQSSLGPSGSPTGNAAAASGHRAPDPR